MSASETQSSFEDAAVLLAPGDTLLQQIVEPFMPETAPLSYRVIRGEVGYENRALVLNGPAKVSFDTYFSSFYESYWSEFTVVSELRIVLIVSGAVTIEAMRDTDAYGSHLIARKTVTHCATPQRVELPLPLRRGAGAPAGRLFFELISHEPSEVHQAGFVTRTTPAAPVRLSVGLCTHNREGFLLPLLRQLLSAVAAGLVHRIFLVNQGQPFASRELCRLLEANATAIDLIVQPNLGGAGGFARTMLACSHADGMTHHLLMDDDVALDPRVLRVAVGFLSFARADLALGGQMANLRRVTALFQAGLRVLAGHQIGFIHPNLALDQPHAARHFNTVQRVDFNGWWFCILPVETIRKAGLPLPMFVHCDDQEYGLRLQARGVPTVTLPGIAVWHEPFDAKPHTWAAYYDLRNQLITAAVHPDRAAPGSWTWLAWQVLKAIAQHDYRRASWMLRAAEDFLAGPNELFRRSPIEIHRAVLDVPAAIRPRQLDPIAAQAFRQGEPRPAPRTPAANALLLAWRLTAAMLFPGRDVRGAAIFEEMHRTPRNIGRGPWVYGSRLASHFELHVPDRRNMLGALRRAARIVARYRRDRDAAATQWRTGIAAFTTEESWGAHFDAARPDAETGQDRSASTGATHASAMRILTTITPRFKPLVDDWLAPSLGLLGKRGDLEVALDHSAQAQGSGDFRSPGFDQHIFNKLELVAAWAERQTHPFLVTDADVIYLRPFEAMALDLLAGKDLLLARELVGRDDHYNIGQMFIRPSPQVSAFFRRIALELRTQDIAARYRPHQPANQDYINSEIRKTALRHGALPETFAHTEIWESLGPDRHLRIVSYHATKTLPAPGLSSLEQKHRRLGEVAASCGVALDALRTHTPAARPTL